MFIIFWPENATRKTSLGDPCWSGIDREGNYFWYRTHRSREVGCSTSSIRTSPKTPEGDGRLWIFPGGGETVVLVRLVTTTGYPVEGETKSDLTARKICTKYNYNTKQNQT